jgi:hypothetical protein
MNLPSRSKHLFPTVTKLVLFLVMVLMPAMVCAQQWTTNGNNINNANSGNVGIGTTTPGSLLAVQKSQNAATSIAVDNPYTTSGNSAYSSFALMQNGVLRLNIASVNDNHSFLTPGTAQFWNFANAPAVFATNNTERMRISASGNVGIGTTSPAAAFHVANATGMGTILVSGSSLGVVSFQDTAAPANAKVYQWRSESGLFRMALVNDAWSGFVNQNILVANTSGYIGIGTAAPLQKLQIGTNTPAAISTPDSVSLGATYSSTAGANAKLRLYDDNAGTVYGLGVSAFQFDLMAPTSATFVWNFGGVEKMRLQNNGTVGIGTPTPNSLYKLDVNGTINATGLTVNGSTVTSSQWATTGTTINYATGNVGIGQATPTEKLDVNGNIKVSGNINAKFQDVAEWVESTQELTPGTVVVLDSTRPNQVIASTIGYDARVAGVISEQPGIALGESGTGKHLVATTGRVRVKVDASNGPIQIGDLLVTSNFTGTATKSIPVDIGGVQIHRPGTLIGKALEPLASGRGEILVLLSLQ